MTSYKKWAAALCILVSSSLCEGTENDYGKNDPEHHFLMGHKCYEDWKVQIHKGDPTSPAAQEAITNMITHWTYCEKKGYKKLDDIIKTLYNPQFFYACATVSWKGYHESLAQGTHDPSKSELAITCAKYGAEERYKHQPSQTLLLDIYYKLGRSDAWLEGLLDLKSFSDAEKKKIQSRMIKAFTKSPIDVGAFTRQLNQGSQAVTLVFLDALCQMKNIPSQLDAPILDVLGARYWDSYLNDKTKETYALQAILYSLLSAKAANQAAYERLIDILNLPKINNKSPHQFYYNGLIPLLEKEDRQAQDLFQKVGFAHQGAITWFKKYIKILERSGQYPNQLEALKKNKRDFKTEKNYRMGIALWSKNPANAVKHLLDAELYAHKGAKEKLKEIRESDGYKAIKGRKIVTNDHGFLLQKHEKQKGKEYFKAFELNFSHKTSQKNNQISEQEVIHAVVMLYRSNEWGSIEAKKQIEKLKKSKYYKNGSNLPEPSDPWDRLAGQFSGYKGLLKHLRDLPDPPPSSATGIAPKPLASTTPTTVVVAPKNVPETQNAPQNENMDLFLNSHHFWSGDEKPWESIEDLTPALLSLITVVRETKKLGSDKNFRNDFCSFITDKMVLPLTDRPYAQPESWLTTVPVLTKGLFNLEALYSEEVQFKDYRDFSLIANPFLAWIQAISNKNLEDQLPPSTHYKIGMLYILCTPPYEEGAKTYENQCIRYLILAARQGHREATEQLVQFIFLHNLSKTFLDFAWMAFKGGKGNRREDFPPIPDTWEGFKEHNPLATFVKDIYEKSKEYSDDSEVVDYFENTFKISPPSTAGFTPSVTTTTTTTSSQETASFPMPLATSEDLLPPDELLGLARQAIQNNNFEGAKAFLTGAKIQGNSQAREMLEEIHREEIRLQDVREEKDKAKRSHKHHHKKEHQALPPQGGKVSKTLNRKPPVSHLTRRNSETHLRNTHTSPAPELPKLRRTQSVMNLSVPSTDRDTPETAKTKKSSKPKKASSTTSELKKFLRKKKSEKKLERSQSRNSITSASDENKQPETPKNSSSESQEGETKLLKKLTRKISSPDLRNQSDVKLTDTIIIDTLNDFQSRGLVKWSIKNNTLKVNRIGLRGKGCSTHRHDKDTSWAENPAFTRKFLKLVGECNPDLAARISTIGQKS